MGRLTRSVVNVATGRYLKGQIRLFSILGTLESHFWIGFPENCPTHLEKPYAFKAHALVEAAKTADLLLWCDASVYPVRSLEPLWERIEAAGYWFTEMADRTNYEWTADSAYADLFPEMSIEQARKINRTFPQVFGTAFGLNIRSDIGAALLSEYLRLSQTQAFVGPWSNTNCPEHVCYPDSSPYTMASCGPPDVRGHRHDQTALSVIAWRLGLKLDPYPGWLSPVEASHADAILVVDRAL